MSKNISSARIQPHRIIGLAASMALIMSMLLISMAVRVASASSQPVITTEKHKSVFLQGPATPTATEPGLTSTVTAGTLPTTTVQLLGPTSLYTFSLTSLGYEVSNLESPRDSARYAFRLPQNWSIENDGALDLDLSYTYTALQEGISPGLFGSLTVTLDGETLTVFEVTEPALEHFQLRLPLPASALNSERNHVIGLEFEARILCDIPHKATLVIHPESFISLSYLENPLQLDLSAYPRPFNQQVFATDSIRLVLPAQPTGDQMTNAVAVAAKLGDLAGNRLVIGGATDLDFTKLPSSTLSVDEHFVIIGRPQDNQALTRLNELVELPAPLHRQQLKLTSQGPAAVAPGDTFTYVFTVTNTLTQPVSLTVASDLPANIEFVECTAGCADNAETREIIWSSGQPAAAKTASFALTLKAMDTLTGTILENTITLTEAELGPLNADTLTTMITPNSADSEPQLSEVKPGDYFFTYNGQAVAKGDGLIQEILSPWNQGRAILIITGLNNEAVQKASQAMSSESRFPGMRGTVALVQDILPLSEAEIEADPVVETSFADLGYTDQIARGDSTQQLDYFFDVPPGWELTDEAAIDLYFTHSQLISFEGSGVTLLLNRKPLASFPLNLKTAVNGHLQVSLAKANLETARPNRLSVQVALALPPSGVCSNAADEQAWFVVKNTSMLFLPHNVNTGLSLDLANYPYPFNTSADLTNLLLALPNTPTVEEWEMALRVAANLGSAAAGKTIIPAATLGDDLSTEELANYNIVAIGRPSRHALIQEVNKQLPQPFLPSSDEIEQRLDNVIFRLPPGVELGYIELISSPWNEDRAFLALTGTSDESVQLVIRTILNRRSGLFGNLALINGDQVTAIDTRPLTQGGVAAAIATAVPEMTPAAITQVETATPMPTPTALASPVAAGASSTEQAPAQSNRPAWLLPLIGINGLLVVAIVAFAFWRSRQNKV